jgi:uncharacterized membrane protein HdeD (DUF308 family)
MTRKSVADVTGDWWSVALRGVVALLAGVVIVVSPIPHQSHLLPVFGAYMVTDGIIELGTAARAVRAHQPWSKAAAQGMLGVLFGLVNLVGSGLPAVVRADFIALRTFVHAVSDIIVARRLRTEGPTRLPAWHLLLGGLGSVIFSVILVVGPALQERLLGRLDWLACLYLVGLGLLLLTLAARLRALHRVPPATPSVPAAAH